LGKPKAGAALFALSQAVIVAGHIPEGNLLEQTRITARHPIWALRADIAVATQPSSAH
jgi:cytochrome c-type biogenesis protein CcmE